MVADIGAFIFIDLLGMTMYPGYPFTGNIIRDAIQFLFIPSVFIILVIYMLVGRLAVPGHKIRVMLAVAVYLFIISGGYYKAFALLAGPYFIFLIFILGLLYFIPAHFGIGGAHAHSGRALGALSHKGAEIASFEDLSFRDLLQREVMLRNLNKQIERLKKDHSPDAQRGVAELYQKAGALEAEIESAVLNMNGIEKQAYKAYKAKQEHSPF
ncbi:MAG: hypothetical protein HY513_00550 [Candidatus Aenigmarchaeota archaeon]|nr:hypothetical protein [Candidatus Aenigmarchaeota archaeon]